MDKFLIVGLGNPDENTEIRDIISDLKFLILFVKNMSLSLKPKD